MAERLVCARCGELWGDERECPAPVGREWNIAEQARIAKESFEARPDWVKRISYFAGTNNVPVDSPPAQYTETK